MPFHIGAKVPLVSEQTKSKLCMFLWHKDGGLISSTWYKKMISLCSIYFYFKCVETFTIWSPKALKVLLITVLYITLYKDDIAWYFCFIIFHMWWCIEIKSYRYLLRDTPQYIDNRYNLIQQGYEHQILLLAAIFIDKCPICITKFLHRGNTKPLSYGSVLLAGTEIFKLKTAIYSLTNNWYKSW